MDEKSGNEQRLDEMTLHLRDILRELGDKLAGEKGVEWSHVLGVILAIDDPEVLRKPLAKIAERVGLLPFSLTVDYGRSIADGIRAGRYDGVSSNIISRHFSTQKTGIHEVMMELTRMDSNTPIEEIVFQMDQRGFRPADLNELLAFGERYPEIQRDLSVVALGSWWLFRDDDRRVPYLRGGGSRRFLSLRGEFDVRLLNFWFAVVRKLA